ncbi:MAG: hypothetical protein IT242_09525 [Bacteroidia bacterium]|nr:hypothetical protein [Bacteroidia bacterium]
MKKIAQTLLFLSIMLLASGLSVKAHTEENAKIKIVMKIIWGRHSDGCRHFGICSVSIEFVDFGSARMVLSKDGKTLITEADLSSIKGKEELFEGNYFIMDEDFRLPDDVQKALGSVKPIIIRQGNYRLERSREGYTIYFEL